MPKPFEIGRLLATPGALAEIERNGDNLLPFLHQHITGVWGDLDDHDQRMNDVAVTNVSRILSAYKLTNGSRMVHAAC